MGRVILTTVIVSFQTDISSHQYQSGKIGINLILKWVS